MFRPALRRTKGLIASVTALLGLGLGLAEVCQTFGNTGTAEAVAPVAAGAVSASLALFVVTYTALLLVFCWFAARVVLLGPGGTAKPAAIRPGLDRAGPTVVGAPAPARTVLVAGE